MKTRIFLFFLLCSFAASAQAYSVQIDSLTSQYTARFARGQQFWIDSILGVRQSSDWLKRVDTMQFDYAFIDEFYDGEVWTEERYFRKGDTLPDMLFEDGEIVKKPYTVYVGLAAGKTRWNTLDPMLERYSKMLPNQELDYEKTRYRITSGCVNAVLGPEAEFRKRHEELLKNTYAIRTMIDKVNKKVIVSVQTAPEHPEFKVVTQYMGVSF